MGLLPVNGSTHPGINICMGHIFLIKGVPCRFEDYSIKTYPLRSYLKY